MEFTILLYLIKKDLKDIFGNKKRIIISLIVLIIVIISTSLYVSKNKEFSMKELKLGVINEDNSSYSKLLLEYFKTSESFSSFITVKEGTQAEIKADFKKGLLDVYLHIPEGFADNLMVLNHLPVEVVINGEDKTRAILIDTILKSYEKYIKAVEMNCVALYDRMSIAGFQQKFINEKNVEISYDLIFTALGKEKFFDYEEIGDYKNTSIFHYLGIAFLCTLTLYIIFYMGLFIRKDKEIGIYGRLYAAGVPTWLYILEKLLFFYGIIALPAIFAVIFIKVFLGITVPLLSLACFSAFLFTGGSFIIFISVFFKKTSDYLLTGNFLCLFFTILGGGLIPVMFLPDRILKLSYFTPTYWMIKFILLSESYRNAFRIHKIIFFLLAAGLIFYVSSLFVYKKEVAVRD